MIFKNDPKAKERSGCLPTIAENAFFSANDYDNARK
jgi:hypothetical protein